MKNKGAILARALLSTDYVDTFGKDEWEKNWCNYCLARFAELEDIESIDLRIDPERDSLKAWLMKSSNPTLYIYRAIANNGLPANEWVMVRNAMREHLKSVAGDVWNYINNDEIFIEEMVDILREVLTESGCKAKTLADFVEEV